MKSVWNSPTVRLVLLCALTGCFGVIVLVRVKSRVPALGDGPSTKTVRIRAAAGMEITPFCGPERVTNPVALTFDDRGRLLVGETFLTSLGTVPATSLGLSQRDDLAFRTTSERFAYLKAFESAHPSLPLNLPDRIRRLADTGDQTLFESPTKYPGVGGGLVARGDSIWYAQSPHLWRLRDTNGDGIFEEKKPILTGFSVHASGTGHDLHGLRFGPDGRLYFSVGDTGCSVVGPDGARVDEPDSGAVLRCNLDGTGLELFAKGLRNPFDLVFDDDGNLFTGDNNQGPVDQSRLVHVVEGSDGGWRFAALPIEKTAYVRERLWSEAWDGQSAAIVPPVATFEDIRCPAGISFAPHAGMLPPNHGRFLLCHFGYTSSLSAVYSFGLTRQGASFAIQRLQPLIEGLIPADVEFGPDGGLYVASWGEGGSPSSASSIHRAIMPGWEKSAEAIEIRKLLTGDIPKKTDDELCRLLGHPDQRVRREAQFTLAEKGAASIPVFVKATTSADAITPAKLHAIWGLGQLAQSAPTAIDAIMPLVADADPRVRGLVARVLGDLRVKHAAEAVRRLLSDHDSSVRALAAIALGRMSNAQSIPDLFALLRENEDRDPVLRHAAIMGLAGTGDAEAILAFASDRSRAVRLGIVVALRRMGRSEVARFLVDPDPRVALEAARAIHDEPITGAMPALADCSKRRDLPEPFLRRALSASFLVGGRDRAIALAEFAAKRDAPTEMRAEVLAMLIDWTNPTGVAPATRQWRTPVKRSRSELEGTLDPLVNTVLEHGPDGLRLLAIRLISTYQITSASLSLERVVDQANLAGSVRAQALAVLHTLDAPRCEAAIERALKSGDSTLRIEALRLLGKSKPDQALKSLLAAMESPDTAERQSAWATLGSIPSDDADRMLAEAVDLINDGTLDPRIRLEVLESARKRASKLTQEALARFEAAQTKGDRVRRFSHVLAGGNPARGKELFREASRDLACIRCHSIQFQAVGGRVGPDLAGIGLKRSPEYLLAAIVDPSRDIAEGFATVTLALNDGRVLTGTIMREGDGVLEFLANSGDPKPIRIRTEEVEERKPGKSAMPDNIVTGMSDRDLRDLVAFLAQLGTEQSGTSRLIRLQNLLPTPSAIDFQSRGLP